MDVMVVKELRLYNILLKMGYNMKTLTNTLLNRTKDVWEKIVNIKRLFLVTRHLNIVTKFTMHWGKLL
jgi:hypothetical protein